MKRAHIFVASIILVLAAALAVLIGIQQAGSHPPARTTDSYTSFSAGTTTYASLAPSGSAARGEQPTSRADLAEIIRSWEARGGVRPRATTSNESSAAAERDDEVGALFTELLGPRVTERMGQPASSEIETDEGALLWSGQYDSTQEALGSETTTEAQQQLRAYGNELGEILTAFERDSDDQVALLDRFIKDRGSEARIDELATLRQRYRTLSDDLAQIGAPTAISDTHTELVQAYADIADGLWALREPAGDEKLVEQLLAYNDTAEAVATLHIELITTFRAYGITFDEHEPGRIFMFSPPSQ